MITNDYSAFDPLKKGYPEDHVELTSHMNVPIFDGDRIVILAGFGNKEEDYDDSDVRQLILLMQGMWAILSVSWLKMRLKGFMGQQHAIIASIHRLTRILEYLQCGFVYLCIIRNLHKRSMIIFIILNWGE